MYKVTYSVISREISGEYEDTWARFYSSEVNKMSSNILPELLSHIKNIHPNETVVCARLVEIIEI